MFLQKSHFEIVLHVFRKSHFEILISSARVVWSIKRLARCPGGDNPILIEDLSGCVPVAVRSSGGCSTMSAVSPLWFAGRCKAAERVSFGWRCPSGGLLPCPAGENINLFKIRFWGIGESVFYRRIYWHIYIYFFTITKKVPQMKN